MKVCTRWWDDGELAILLKTLFVPMLSDKRLKLDTVQWPKMPTVKLKHWNGPKH